MRLRKTGIMATALCVVMTLGANASEGGALSGDAVKGEKVFRKCAACHKLGPEAKHRVGPILNDILGKAAGTQEGFKYSSAMVEAGQSGLVWSEKTLDAFLENPKREVPKTKMSFRGLRKPSDRADVVAFLANYSSDIEHATSDDPAFVVAPEILGIEGDIEWGEYLSSECTTCHQVDGGDDGIPAIVGWESEDFVTAMHAYREKHRSNAVMQVIAGRLGDEEIAGLAAYFKGLGN